MSDWDDLVEPARGALEALISKGDAMTDRIEELVATREELEANINTKADFIDATINQLAASDQRIEELEAKLEKLERWQAAALIAHCNLDLDIEANPEALAELKGQTND